MCMSCPQRVLSFSKGKALVEFQGTEKKVNSPMPLKKGEYVLCQAGMVVRKIPESEAKKMLREWRELNDF